MSRITEVESSTVVRLVGGSFGILCTGLLLWFVFPAEGRWPALLILFVSVGVGVISGYYAKKFNRPWLVYCSILLLMAILYFMPLPWSFYFMTPMVEVTLGNLLGAEIAYLTMYRPIDVWLLNGKPITSPGDVLEETQNKIAKSPDGSFGVVRLSFGTAQLQACGNFRSGFVLHVTSPNGAPSGVVMLWSDDGPQEETEHVMSDGREFLIPDRALAPWSITKDVLKVFVADKRYRDIAGWTWRGDGLSEELYVN